MAEGSPKMDTTAVSAPTEPALSRARESGKCALINVWVDPDVFSPGTMHQTMYK